MKITINNEKEKLKSLYIKGYQSLMERANEVIEFENSPKGDVEGNSSVHIPEFNLQQEEVDELFRETQVLSEIMFEYPTDSSLEDEIEQIKDIVNTNEKKYLHAVVIFKGDVGLMEISDIMEVLSKMVQDVCMFICSYSTKQKSRCKTLFVGIGEQC